MATVPIVSAYHISVGASDSVGVAPAESAAGPSVPAASSVYRIGTGADACTRFEPTGDGINAGAIAADAATVGTAHPFCKRLVYNFGTAQQVTSPPDQHYPLNGAGEVWRFDAVFTTYVGSYGQQVNTCGLSSGPCQIIVNVGRMLGLWPDDYNTICQQEKDATPAATACGWQEYAVNFAAPNAVLALQDQARSTAGISVAQGNGWFLPAYDQTILGYLFLNGQPVDADALKARVAAHVAAGRLPAGAVPSICGSEPEPQVATQSGVSNLVGWCEVAFDWVESEPANPLAPRTSYNYGDPCTSRAYFCGMIGGGAWFATEVCSFHPRTGAGINECNVDDWGQTSNGYESTFDYDVWHFVVAPSLSPCNGRAPPGFLTTPIGAAQPYIAHDLDIFAPLGSSVAKTGLDDVDRLKDYYVDGDDDVTDLDFDGSQVDRTVDDVGEPVIRKNANIEPNAAGDTSGTLTAARVAAHPCAPIVNGGLQRPGRTPMVETAFDPWVNYVDNRVSLQNGGIPGLATLVAVNGAGTTYDAYANTDANQDASNRAANGFARLAGRVGFFADADDDFARVDAEDEYEAINPNYGTPTSDPQDIVNDLDPLWIESIGAYTMFWDSWLDLSGGNPLNKWNCKAPWAASLGASLTSEMAVAGYEPTRTGLVQVVYTSLPTVAYPLPVLTSASLVAPAAHPGGTALVFLSQALHELRSHGTAADQAFVAGLVSAAIANLPAPPASVVYARDVVVFGTNQARLQNYQSDFGDQCGGTTGAFGNRWVLLRACDGKQAACRGDTVVTGYTFLLNAPMGSAAIPAPPVALATGVQHTWWDVDPFDNDPARNT